MHTLAKVDDTLAQLTEAKKVTSWIQTVNFVNFIK